MEQPWLFHLVTDHFVVHYRMISVINRLIAEYQTSLTRICELLE